MLWFPKALPPSGYRGCVTAVDVYRSKTSAGQSPLDVVPLIVVSEIGVTWATGTATAGSAKDARYVLGVSSSSEEQTSPLATCLQVSVVMLLLAIPPIWPYGYYMLLRLVVCGTASFGAILAYTDKKQAKVVPMAIVALLFNPLIPIYLNKGMWSIIDIVVAIYFGAVYYRSKRSESGDPRLDVSRSRNGDESRGAGKGAAHQGE